MPSVFFRGFGDGLDFDLDEFLAFPSGNRDVDRLPAPGDSETHAPAAGGRCDYYASGGLLPLGGLHLRDLAGDGDEDHPERGLLLGRLLLGYRPDDHPAA